MIRSKTIVAGSLCFALTAVSTATVWAVLASGAQTHALPSAASGFRADVAIAGPLTVGAFSAVPSYWKHVTFATDELDQYRDIAARLPAGNYFVKVQARSARSGRSSLGPDCMGVAFALAPSGSSFRGYVSVPHDGDAATVLCYDEATSSTSTATFDVFYTPINATHKEHS